MEDKFKEIKYFVNLMSERFNCVGVMKIKTDDAKWLVDEVDSLRNKLKQFETDGA